MPPYDDRRVVEGPGRSGPKSRGKAAGTGAEPDVVVLCYGGGGLTAGDRANDALGLQLAWRVDTSRVM